jgi:serine/threonine protein phosphatase PrpC
VTAVVADHAGVTQTGNVRRSNEDSFLLRSPLFVVADGMGGARAGELASRLAAQAFAEVDLIRLRDEDALRATIETANTRIWERSQSDASAAGMGTTVTAALVTDDGTIVFAHVGDSRAYLLRDGELRRLSHDHSLVGEMVRKGELSEAEAEQHPQRNVITRSLGTEPAVETDVFSVDSRPGDVILLCSDGLTTMVPEDAIATMLAGDGSASDVARELVRAALRGGGEDNVTAIVVRMGDAAAEDERTPSGSGAHILPADIDAPEAPPPRGWRRAAAVAVVLAVLAVIAAVAAVVGLRASHFIGADQKTGRVAIYQGVPVDLPFGVHLYHVTYESPLSYATLSPAQRATLFDHRLRSSSAARAALHPYEVASP